MQSRRWCFTLNNFTEDEKLYIAQAYVAEEGDVQYVIYEEEHTQGEGTPHLQGYIEFAKKVRATTVKRIVGQRAHIEIARGTPQQNIAYCSKENKQTELGEHRSAAEGNQWDHIKTLVRNGDRQAIFDQYFGTYLKYMKSIEALCTRYAPPPPEVQGDLKQKNLWIWGPPGTGKSKKARHDFGEDVYAKNANKWWDGFRGQGVVVIEDLDPERSRMLTQFLKVWMDRYPFEAEVKGGSLLVSPEFKFIVTSNYPPELCFAQEDLEAIRRRCTVIHMDRLE